MNEKYGEYKALTKVGGGSFGNVYLAVKEGENIGYSLKVMEKEQIEKEDLDDFNQEIDILSKLSGSMYTPNLYDFRKYDEKNVNHDNPKELISLKKDDRPYYVTDFFSKSSLSYYITKMKNGFCEPHAKIIFKKIIEGIKFCHDKNVCHLDLKPRNIVINKNFDPIIIDFGFSEEFNESTTFKKGKGSKRYISPEMWEEKEYDGVKSDIFSLGVILFNLVTRSFGFCRSIVKDDYYKFIIEADSSGNYENYWDSIKFITNKIKLSEDFKNLYTSMVAYDPKKRPTTKEILESNWLKKLNDLSKEEREKLENDVLNNLKNLYEEIKDSDLKIRISDNIIEEKKLITKGSNSTNSNVYFESDMEPKYISKDRINLNHFIEIIGDLPEVDFMNDLANIIDEKLKNKMSFKSKENLKLELFFEYDKNEIEKVESTMEIELLKYEKGDYLLEFLNTKGDIADYYEHFCEIKEIIKTDLFANCLDVDIKD